MTRRKPPEIHKDKDVSPEQIIPLSEDAFNDF